ncbi:MAG: hypothetical protein MJ189_00245 [Coriobacteriales bacterium]|nr:hypothetical protein [Coriobacteriales bacterium]
MQCPRCKSTNVSVQVVHQSQLVNDNYGCLWWALIGWWWVPIKWIFFTFFALIWFVIKPRRQKIVNHSYKEAICQDCAFVWDVSYQEAQESEEIYNRQKEKVRQIKRQRRKKAWQSFKDKRATKRQARTKKKEENAKRKALQDSIPLDENGQRPVI